MSEKPFYEFGGFRLDPAEYVLSRDGLTIPLTPKLFQTLLVLVQNSGHIVDKEELFKQVWQDAFVEETNLTKNISILRKVLSEGDPNTSFIETVPKRGYRFIVPVRRAGPGSLNGSTRNVSQPPDASAEHSVTGNRHRAAAVFALTMLVVGAIGVILYLRSSVGSTAIESVAVMPFVNDSGNSDNEYLADGITETLINGLSQIPGVSVKNRSSVFRYKGKEFDPRVIGNELGVQAVIYGRLVGWGDQLTLNVELIDAATENVLWGNRYERKLSELIQLQSDVARDVSGRLRSSLSGAEQARVTKTYTTDPRAFELYLKGRYFDNKRSEESLDKAAQAFNEAIALDPNYALAYAGLSAAYSHGAGNLTPPETRAKAYEYARKALEIDDSLAAAHNSIANLKFFSERDVAAARREFQRAIELDPNDPFICQSYSQFMALLGNSHEAIEWGRREKRLAPLDGSSGLAQAFILAGRYDEALQEAKETLELDDNYFWSHYWRGLAYSEKGMHDEAIAALKRAVEITDSSNFRGALAHALARAGRREEARRIVDELIRGSNSIFVPRAAIAMAYIGLGDKDQAIHWLDRSFESTEDQQLLYIKTHPMFAPLREDPRFKELLKKLGLDG